MAIRLLRGPPGGGKSQWLKENAEGDIHLDTTTIWAAIMGLERDPDGLFRERLEDETGLRMAQYLKWTGLRFAALEDLDAWFTIANSSPEVIERVRAVVEEVGGKFGRVHTVDPGIDVAMQRLAFRLTDYGVEAVDRPRSTYGLLEECETALANWYGSTPAQTAAVRLKLARQWRREGGGTVSTRRPTRRGR